MCNCFNMKLFIIKPNICFGLSKSTSFLISNRISVALSEPISCKTSDSDSPLCSLGVSGAKSVLFSWLVLGPALLDPASIEMSLAMHLVMTGDSLTVQYVEVESDVEELYQGYKKNSPQSLHLDLRVAQNQMLLSIYDPFP